MATFALGLDAQEEALDQSTSNFLERTLVQLRFTAQKGEAEVSLLEKGRYGWKWEWDADHRAEVFAGYLQISNALLGRCDRAIELGRDLPPPRILRRRLNRLIGEVEYWRGFLQKLTERGEPFLE